MEVIIIMFILIVVGIASLTYWHKKINPETTWIYAIYCLMIIILFLLFAWTRS